MASGSTFSVIGADVVIKGDIAATADLHVDGTIEGVVSDWMYDAKINRTIHVDSRFMLWTMEKVDGATRLLKEMGVAAE